LLNLARKSLLITMIICFAAMVTGLTLILHLSSIEHPEKHDSEHCQICQQLLTAPSKFAPEPELALDNSSQFQHYVEFRPSIYVERFYPQSFNPRPPPYIS